MKKTDGSRRVSPADAEIGKRVRACRLAEGESQTALADVLGIRFQQVQKYERGDNRISSATLAKIADHYQRPIAEFMPSTIVKDGMSLLEYITDQSAARLNKAFARVKDSERRREIVRAVELMCAP